MLVVHESRLPSVSLLHMNVGQIALERTSDRSWDAIVSGKRAIEFAMQSCITYPIVCAVWD